MFVMAVGILLLSACTNVMNAPEQEIADSPKNPHTISIVQALKNLDDFMADEEGHTKAVKHSVKSILPVYSNRTSRSASSDENAPLIYVANFDNDEGFAILAAHDGIPAQVIGVSENGSIDQRVLNRVNSNTSNRNIFPNYPTDGPGIISIAGYDEEFINPNTFNFRIPEMEDTLVGNLDLTEVPGYDSNLFVENNAEEGVKEYIMRLCLNYAQESISHPDEGYSDQPVDSIVTIGEGEEIVDYFTPWQQTEIKEPLLERMEYWHQHSPFNDFFPSNWFTRDKYSAGCFPLAISKILAHYNGKFTFSHNGIQVIWSYLLNGSYLLYNSETGRKSAAALLRNVALGCKSILLPGGTFTFPNNAKAFMRSHGFYNIGECKYNFSRIKGHLLDNKPLLIYGWHGFILQALVNAHAWNIDGYKIKYREKRRRTYTLPDGPTTDVLVEPLYMKMVHCDYGWGGKYNGWYVSGILDSRNKDTEFDHDYNESERREWFTTVYLITYDIN